MTLRRRAHATLAPAKDAETAKEFAAVMPATVDADANEDAGIDVTLIRWCLALTPQERSEALQAIVNAIVRLRDAARPTS